MVLRHIRPEEVPAEAIKKSNRAGREANRPTGTEINLTTETAQQAAGDASDAKTAADQAAEDALAAVSEAGAVRTLAEGLYQVIPSETEPTSSPAGELKAGDQWWVVGAGPLAGKFIGVKVYDGAAWVDRQIVASSVLVPGSVGNVLIADGAVDGKVITGALIRTAEDGMRLELTPDGLGAFNASDAKVATLFASSGGLAIDGTMQARAGDATFERTADMRGEQMTVGTFRVGADYVSTVGMIPGIGTPGVAAHIFPDAATGTHHKDAAISADSSGAHVRLRRYLPDDSDYSSLVMQLLNDKSARIWSTDGALLVLAQEGPITLRSETHGVVVDGPTEFQGSVAFEGDTDWGRIDDLGIGTLGPGISHSVASYYTGLNARVKGGVLYISGRVQRTGGIPANHVLFTLAPEFRPPVAVVNYSYAGNANFVVVNPNDGTCFLALASTGNVSVVGLSWPLG